MADCEKTVFLCLIPFTQIGYICLRMLKLNQSTFDKLEELLVLGGYKVRTEKGNFKSGSCIIEQSKLIVVNKYSPVETKVAFLMDAIRQLELDQSMFDERYTKLLNDVRQQEPQADEATVEAVAADAAESVESETPTA